MPYVNVILLNYFIFMGDSGTTTHVRLPQQAQDVIHQYAAIAAGAHAIACPYFINKRRKRKMQVPALVGKGSPREIEEEIRILAKRRRRDLSSMSAEEVKRFVREEGIGIDCSGFAAHVLRAYVREEKGKDFFRELFFPAKGIRSWIARRISPVRHISTAVISHPKNSAPVPLRQIAPGDLIFTKGGSHVLVVSEVERKGDMPVRVSYWQSREWDAVRKGEIRIYDASLPLHEQEWQFLEDNIPPLEMRRLFCVGEVRIR